VIEQIVSTSAVTTQTTGYQGVAREASAPAAARLAIHETTTYRWSFLEDVTGYREAEIESIAVWRPKLVEFGEEKAIELIRDSGLAVSSLSWAGGFTGANSCTFEEAIDDARDAVRTAGLMEAGCLVLISGSRAGHTMRHARRLLIQAIRALADDAAEHNVLLALQPLEQDDGRQWSFLHTLDQALDVLHECGEPRARLAFDAQHLCREPRAIERIPEIAPLVATVQLSDRRSAPHSNVDRCLPGDGELPLRDVTRAFLAADYSGSFEIGAWSDDVWNSDYADVLHTCRQRFDALIRP
jgi:sugar phosphate isomerase/epimerase